MTDAQKLCDAYRAELAANPAQNMARWAARQTKGFPMLINEKWGEGQRKWVRCPDGSQFAYSFGDVLVPAEAWAAPAEVAAKGEMTSMNIPATQNHEWGFWGTMAEHARTAWPIASKAIHDATDADRHAVRAFLDSRYGRHFADGVNGQMHGGASLTDAIAKTTAEWMGWRITRRMSRETGIPAGLPYLTGLVMNEAITAEFQED